MLIRCINRPFRDLVADGKPLRKVGDEWEATPERLAAINGAGYGKMAEPAEEEPSEPSEPNEPSEEKPNEPSEEKPSEPSEEKPWWDGKTRVELVEMASEKGIDVPSKASKAEIAEMLGGE